MTAVVFAGPSLHGVPPELLAEITVLPPAECGDVARAARNGARLIGLIDGLFETTASVWHKELLWVLSKGVDLYGSSSMGALRAAEMWQFGMRGVGIIYRLYRHASIIDDDEVALVHGPRDAGFIPLTEAMVNVRMTLRRARHSGLITPECESAMVQIAKSIFYKNRTYDRILALSRDQQHLQNAAAALRRGLERVRRDAKRDDAILLVSRLQSIPTCRPAATQVEFTRTSFWDMFERELMYRESRK
jgi:hypothetical protein